MWYLRGWWEKIDLGIEAGNSGVSLCFGLPDRSGSPSGGGRGNSRRQKNQKTPGGRWRRCKATVCKSRALGRGFYTSGVAESLMAVLCRSRRVCMSKWRGWKGREEKGRGLAVARKRAGCTAVAANPRLQKLTLAANRTKQQGGRKKSGFFFSLSYFLFFIFLKIQPAFWGHTPVATRTPPLLGS